MRISLRIPCFSSIGIPSHDDGSGRSTTFKACLVVLLLLGLVAIITVTAYQSWSVWHRQTEADRHPRAAHKYAAVAIATDVKNPSLHYGVVVDCGSSGSRVYVYVWPPHSGDSEELLHIREMRDKHAKVVVKKIEPGISSYVDKPSEASEYLKPLLQFASKHVPKDKHKESPLYIMATAGMRLLTQSDQDAILADLRLDIPTETDFLFQDTHAEVISGKQEGVYAWISINYALGKFDHTLGDDPLVVVQVPGTDGQKTHIRKRTVGIMDMGGGSLQIAYEVPKSVRFQSPKDDLAKSMMAEFNLGCTSSDIGHIYRVYVATYLGFGGNEARRRYEKHILGNMSGSYHNNSSQITSIPSLGEQYAVPDPCLTVDNVERVTHEGQDFFFRGMGNLSACQNALRPLLNRSAPCWKEPCAMNGVFQPDINYHNSEFYGFSEFYYTTEDILRMSGPYNHRKFQHAAKEFCSQKWSSILEWYEQNLYPRADKNRFRYQCFKSAWISEVFHTGLSFPKTYKHLSTSQLVSGREVHWSLGALLYKTRFYPLSDIQKHETHQSGPLWMLRQLSHATYLLIICFIIVAMAIILHLRRLRIVRTATLRKIPSLAMFISEEGEMEHSLYS